MKYIPIVGPGARGLWRAARRLRSRFTQFHSPDYWESRYAGGGNSGSGSYGHLAEFKAAVLNAFVANHEIRSIIEFGCGDGHQLSLSKYPEYVGIDVSPSAVKGCKKLFQHDASKRFLVSDGRCANSERGDLALSLDVIYHLVEDDIYEQYMCSLFDAADRFVIIYSDNEESPGEESHLRHRRFTDWIESNRRDWQMVERIPNQFPRKLNHDRATWADFWIYARAGGNNDGAVLQ